MFTPTNKQQESIVKMSSALRLTPVENFESSQQFQEYFKYLMDSMKKAKKTANFKKAVFSGKVDMKKVEEKKYKYYEDNPKKLEEKAKTYTYKYLPSIKKLEIYLRRKTRNPEQIKEIIEKINIDEEKMIKQILYIKRELAATPYHKILNYLYNKKFDNELIKNMVQDHKQKEDTPDFYDITEHKIKRKLEKLCSKRELESDLYVLGISQGMISEYIERLYNEDEQNILLQEEIERLKERMTEDKIIKKLTSKGHYYNKIQAFL